VIAMTPNPLGPRFEEWRHARLAAYARAVREVAKAREAPLVDVWEMMERLASQPGSDIGELLLDGMHPNDAGHQRVAAGLAREIARLESAGHLSRREPRFEELDLFVSGEMGVAQYRIPALAATGQGTLLAVCDARVDRAGDAPNDIDLHMRRSTDGGRSWSEATPIVDYPGTRAAADPSLTVDRQTGAVWLSYVFAEEEVGLAGGRNEPGFGGDTFHIRLHCSDDEGLEWSEPIDVTRRVKDPSWLATWNAPGKGIQLRDGRLLIGVSAMTAEREHQTHLLWSDDHGVSWHCGAAAGHGTNESQAVELAGGEILLSMRRNGARDRLLARSGDGGRTWSEARPHSELTGAAGRQGCLHRLHREGDPAGSSILVHSYPGRPGARADMSLFLSFDEGRSWPVRRRVNDGYAAYSCLATLPDGDVGLLYECSIDADGRSAQDRREGTQTIRFARFDLDWLLTPDS